jgi:sn-glycerol 3-phosphate transport system ATP-binding protein
VRPEHIGIGRDAGVEVRIEGVEYLGADSLLTCRIGGQPLAIRVSGLTGLSLGYATRLSWARGAQHFFDRSSGRRAEGEDSHHGATMLA